MLSFSASQFTRARTNYLPALGNELERRKSDILKEIDERDHKYFAAEVEKLDAWADDLKIGLEQKIKSLDKEIREVRRTAKVAPVLNEKTAIAEAAACT